MLHICDLILKNRPNCHNLASISRNTDLSIEAIHGSLVLDCSHARFTV